MCTHGSDVLREIGQGIHGHVWMEHPLRCRIVLFVMVECAKRPFALVRVSGRDQFHEGQIHDMQAGSIPNTLFGKYDAHLNAGEPSTHRGSQSNYDALVLFFKSLLANDGDHHVFLYKGGLDDVEQITSLVFSNGI